MVKLAQENRIPCEFTLVPSQKIDASYINPFWRFPGWVWNLIAFRLAYHS